MVKYEIDMSTLMIMSISENTTRVITIDDDFIVNDNSLSIMNYSCCFFGNSLKERQKDLLIFLLSLLLLLKRVDVFYFFL